MDANERLVREKWKAVGNLWWDREYDENWISASDEKGQPIRLFRGRSTDAAAWQTAADFTRAHENKIRDVEEEIAWLLCKEHMQNLADRVPWQRTLAARQAALNELKRGWRG